MIESAEKRSGTAARFRQAEKSKGTVVDGDVFKARDIGRYLKT